jgi:hypothetical protein
MNLKPLILRLSMRVAPRAAAGMAAAGGIMGYGSSIVDLRGELPVRADMSFPTRSMSDIEGLVIHHSATQSQSIRSIAQFHTEMRKWPGISYHFAIDQQGVIYQMNSLTDCSYHAQGYNRRTIGMVLLGNFQEGWMPEPMLESLIVMNEHLRDEYNLKYAVLHKDTKKTACPGKFAEMDIRPYLYGELP